MKRVPIIPLTLGLFLLFGGTAQAQEGAAKKDSPETSRARIIKLVGMMDQEMGKHRHRLARLIRLQVLMQAAGDKKGLSRVKVVMTKEDKRHAAAMSKLERVDGNAAGVFHRSLKILDTARKPAKKSGKKPAPVPDKKPAPVPGKKPALKGKEVKK